MPGANHSVGGRVRASCFALLVVLVLASTSVTARADVAGDPHKRIVGGQTTSIADWPWQVALVQQGSGSAYNRQFCGGSLLTPTIVLTAAHCLYDSGSFTPANQIAVVTGRTNLSSSSGQEIDVAAVHILRGGGGQVLYNPSTNAYDVELLQLAQPASSGTIKLAGADESDLWTGGRTAYVTGWGATTPSGGGYPDDLRMAQVRMFSDSECAGEMGNLFVASVMVCAGAPPSRDTCFGDSGGPLVVPMAAGGFRLVGDTSFGLDEDCGLSPSAYGRVSAEPLRSLIRNKVLQLTGVDVVGAGGDPPSGGGGGGGGGGITLEQAQTRALAYSERACYSYRKCRRYSAGPCAAEGVGFVCQVRNYDRSGRRKQTCKRRVSITLSGTTIVAQPLGRWTCRRGWRRNEAARPA
jgi:V8-like Glu-specific endopeptidase